MPELVIMGGPNGAGKTTVAFKILPEYFNNIDFVNADIIAKGLSAFNTPSVDFEAGRIMLNRLRELKSLQKNFSFESTLASKSLLPFIKECKKDGYKVTIIYVWVKDAHLSVSRVLKRKNEGGHFVPDEIVKRRYERSRINFIEIYMPLADEWKIYDNTDEKTNIIAEKSATGKSVYNNIFWSNFMNEIKEPVVKYKGDRLDQLVQEAIREELHRKYLLNLPIVFMKDDKIITIEGKDLYKYKEEEKTT